MLYQPFESKDALLAAVLEQHTALAMLRIDRFVAAIKANGETGIDSILLIWTVGFEHRKWAGAVSPESPWSSPTCLATRLTRLPAAQTNG
jgi:AcrR family transcriptional regulator